MVIEKYDFNYNVSLKTINCINDIDYTYHISNHDYPTNHLHLDYFELTLLTNGMINNVNENQKLLIESGTLFITLDNKPHHLEKVTEDVGFINIICRKRVLDEASKLFNTNMEELLTSSPSYKLSEELVYLIKSNIDFVNSLKEDEWQKCNAVLKSTVISVLNHIYLTNLKTNYNGERWEIIMNKLKQNPDFYSYNVNQLCDILGYSRTQLNRIFMNKYALTPYEYLKDLKMKYAQSLISHTDYSISEIAKMVGYTNQSQFNKNFKEKYHKLPYEYRING